VRDLPQLPARDEIRSVTFTLRGDREFTRSDARPLLTMVMREEFDAALLDRALAAGAQIRQRAMVRAITEGDGCAAVRLSDGSTVTASVVIGADGSSGVTARHVGVTFDQVDLGLELEIAIPPAVQREWAGRILLDWGKIPASYGWVFPKGDRLTVGVIAARNGGSRFAEGSVRSGSGKQGEATREYLRDLVGRLGLAGFEAVRDSGHLTRCRSDDSPLRSGRVIVAGDAAGLLEPWTREGISFALRSGALAGEMAAKACTGADVHDPLDEYAAAIHRGLAEEMRASRVLLSAFTRHTGTFHKGLATPKGWRAFLGLCRSELTYPEIVRKPAVRMTLSVLNRLLLCGNCMAITVDGAWCVRFPGVSMGGKWMSHALDWDLSAADVLRLVRGDAHPVALLGAWAGGSDIIASVPVATSRQLSVFDGDFHEEPGGFGGGWIGYLGYGAAGGYLPVPPAPGGPRHLPVSWWGYYDHVLRRDRATGRWYFEALRPAASNQPVRSNPAATAARAEALAVRLEELQRRAAAGPPAPAPYEVGAFTLTPSAAEHLQAVRRTVEYVVQGDIFQANICLRLESAFHGDPLDAFCAAVTRLDPPYAAFLRLPGGAAVASLSPELFLRRTGDRVQSSPIKGTWPRPEDPLAAELSRKELEGSAKDGAENVMIVDLMRNDVSRVCVPGSVQVPALLRAEPHPGIWHLVSDVVGTLPPDADDESLIAATFPPGSVTGAPKVRALEIIHELEPVPREVYTGSIGYRSPLAGLELNVAIRTFEFQGSRVWLGAGGGITARSVPESEYQECLVKATPLIQAIGGVIDPEGASRGGALPEGLRPRAAMGVFSSLLVTDGMVADLDEHLARLEASAIELYGKRLPEQLLSDLAACLAKRPSGRLRLTARPVGGPLQVKVEVVPIETVPSADAAPSPVVLSPVVLPGGHGRHKWHDRRQLAELISRAGRDGAPGPDDHLLIVDADGDVLETDRGNVFAVIDGTLCTPPLDGRLLPGITRATVLRLAAQAGIPAKEVRLTVADLADAAEVFATNAVRGLIPVRSGPVSDRLRIALAERPERPDLALAAERGTAAQRTFHARWPAGDAGHRGARPVIVLIDNYDSFTYNLAHLLSVAGCEVEVVSNDEVPAAQVATHRPDGIIISPGPCAPAEAGISVDVIRACGQTTPILGICLGHQAIAVAYGGTVVRATSPAHGFASPVSHEGAGVLAGLPADFPAARYHSLVVDEASLPPELRVTARLADETGIVMGLQHASHPVEGLQFHPESILTVPYGRTIVGNFLQAVRIIGASARALWFRDGRGSDAGGRGCHGFHAGRRGGCAV
jgi:para-aminobenzoate synthetase / 4-amino-4-deoxychorismate lyase